MNSMIIAIPLSALVSSDHNVRQSGQTTARYLEGIEALASSIAAQGLRATLSGMKKKADLAMEAERRLAGTGWVPALLRSGSEATRS